MLNSTNETRGKTEREMRRQLYRKNLHLSVCLHPLRARTLDFIQMPNCTNAHPNMKKKPVMITINTLGESC